MTATVTPVAATATARRRRRIRWYTLPALAFVALMAFNVQKLVRAAPPTIPRGKDVDHAARTAAPPAGASDERAAPMPADTVSGPGVVEPAQPESRIGAAVPGRIARIAVVEGQRVEAGAVLVELDASVEQAALAAAVAEVEAARAQLTRAVRGSRSQDIEAAIADADTATSRAALSKGIAARLEQAGAAGGATADELDRARRQAEADDAAARSADARRGAVLAGSRREDIQLARAQVAAAEARRDQASATALRLQVRAPFAGAALQVKQRLGEYYQPGGEPLVVLADTSATRVRMDVDERDLGRVFVGALVTLRANAFPGADFSGTVVELGQRMGRKNVRSDDPTERNDTKILEVVIAVDDPRGLVFGQRVTCYIAGRAPDRAAAGK